MIGIDGDLLSYEASSEKKSCQGWLYNWNYWELPITQHARDHQDDITFSTSGIPTKTFI